MSQPAIAAADAIQPVRPLFCRFPSLSIEVSWLAENSHDHRVRLSVVPVSLLFFAVCVIDNCIIITIIIIIMLEPCRTLTIRAHVPTFLLLNSFL